MPGTVAHRAPRCVPWLLFRKSPWGRSGGAHFTPQPGAAWRHFPPAPSPGHSYWITHRWVTRSPLLAQGLAGTRGAPCCLPPFRHCSTPNWSFLSLIKHLQVASGLTEFFKRSLLILFLPFPTCMHCFFYFISHHPATQLPHLCSLSSPGPLP